MSVKKVIYFAAILVLVVIINNLAHSVYGIWQKKDLVVKTQAQLDKQKREHEELKKKLSNVNRSQFLEEEARNKLFLVKPGEEIVVIPSGAIGKTSVVKPTTKQTKPNWRKWWELFTTTP